MSTKIESFQTLLRERAQEFLNETYEAHFRAVARSEKGAELLSKMHRSESGEDFFNQLSGVPIKNPRSCALVGLQYGSASDEEFRRRWLEFQRTGKKPESSSAGPTSSKASKSGPDSSPYSDVPLESLTTADARSKFLAEVQRLMSLGKSYDQAWSIAVSAAPSRYHYQSWQAGAEAEKASQQARVKRQQVK